MCAILHSPLCYLIGNLSFKSLIILWAISHSRVCHHLVCSPFYLSFKNLLSSYVPSMLSIIQVCHYLMCSLYYDICESRACYVYLVPIYIQECVIWQRCIGKSGATLMYVNMEISQQSTVTW